MPGDQRRALGALGERLAVERLEATGYRIRELNARTRFGEIDIIAESRNVLVFVEVRCRRGHGKGTASESLSAGKQRRLVALAEAYGQAHPDLPDAWRIDVVAIDFAPDGRLVSLHHIENAVTGD